MKTINEKTTIYLDPKIKKSVRYYALRDDKSLSEIINDRLYQFLEEQEDAASLDAAKKNTEPFISFEDAMEDLGLNLEDIRNSAAAERAQAAKENR